MTTKLRSIFPILAVLFALVAPMRADVAQPSYPRPPEPETAPSRFGSDLYTVDKILVESTSVVGEMARYRIRVEALGDIEQIRVLENLPAGLEYVSAEPAPAETKGGSYMWTWPNMTRGTSQDIVITVRPTQGGWFVTNTKVAVVPTLGLPIFAGTPKLELTKTGPTQAELGDDINFRLTVSNVGNAPARDVIVSDTLPAGLYGPDRSSNVVTHRVGTLAAGETRIIDVPVKAGIKGEWDNRANAYSTHHVQANAVAHVSIVESKVSITKTGPDRAFVFSTGGYAIKLTNEGDTVLENIQLTDEIPEGARYIGSSYGGAVSGNHVSWTIDRLAPGESTIREVQISAQRPATLTAVASAKLATGRTAHASATTEWEGAPGVLTEIVDDVDPVKTGTRVTYSIKITNQSPMRELTSDAVFTLAPNMSVVEVTKNMRAEVSGRTITIKNISLKARGSVSFKIVAKADEPGIGGIRFEFGSGLLPRPVVKEESTYVY
ncbi:DUF11 domain-containing protein [Ereboglobus luteus]|uniref:DUF11 domain-containing protein n=1 Tax=Ereboglobus luteus TaxID=1796921 RepID=A0A2U8E111_9BACT|nr:DUF11 domain-containing protein [Ereboglobus luteus]AWI08465.1 hypothetical protein CKA38_03660 [Ereboglobus luteus]